MTEPQATVVRRRVSAVWIVPVVAMLLGLWLVIDAYRRQGPEVRITFSTAEGIDEDATPVKVRNVEVGVVSKVALSDDLSAVVVTADLTADARGLLREDTRFWVVRPRVSRTGISGLGTIVSGAYIEIAPGIGDAADDYDFEGLDHEPPTPAGTPGLRVVLVSDSSGSLGVGDPVIYRGYSVGRVESSDLDVDSREVRYSVFIDSPYDRLVTSSTRFWNASGISAALSAEGATLSLASIDTLIAGGVAFDLPLSAVPGNPVGANEEFQLYADEASIDANPYRYGQQYVVSFYESVRGLNPGAPVTFRGIRIGSVERIMVREGTAEALDDGSDRPIPVLIRIEPGRFEMEDSRAGVQRLREALARAAQNGLRGVLESGNLLTGSLYVNFDFVDGVEPASVADFNGKPTLPTISGVFARLQQQVGQLLAKLNGLPLDQSVASANASIEALGTAAEALRDLLASDSVRELPEKLDDSLRRFDRTLAAYADDGGLPAQLTRTLEELDDTLQSVRAVAETLERDPNAVIFPTRPHPDPAPRAGRP
ncbi:MAG: intermembrane transport protein PqiB [Pseudomonadales bacterium]